MVLVWEYWRKEFLLHFRQPQKILAILLLATLILVIFHFALGAQDKQKLSVGIYWVQFLIIGSLALQKVLISDETSGMSNLIRLSLVSPLVVYSARLVAVLVFWGICQGLQLVVAAVLYDERFFSEFFGLFLTVIACGAGFLGLGLAVTITIKDYPFLEFVLPLLVFPLAIPIFLSGLEIFNGLIGGGDNVFLWVKLLALCDLIFIIGGLILSYIID